MVHKRRRADDEDDLALFLGSPPRPPNAEPEVDELGRDIDPATRRPERRAARKARHARRAAAKAAKSAKGPSMEEEEGYSTDASLDSSDASDLQDALAALASRAEDIMADVRAPEFRDPATGAGLAKWFGEWRARYEDIYVGAWGGLGVVGAWEFWARLEMVQRAWSPFERRGPAAGGRMEVEGFRWFAGLFAYSHPRSRGGAGQGAEEEEGEGEVGPEGDLAAAMVGTAVVPRVVKMVEGGGFDPYDAGIVRSAVEFGEQVEVACGKEAKFQVRRFSIYACSSSGRGMLIGHRCTSKLCTRSSRRKSSSLRKGSSRI
jgi:GC-rich sequence DNA-binding factor